ncbi:MAG: metallophosphoesterase [Caldilineaceae bacterium SB0661_bin_32]|uniref:Phosphoesterase n=1 Tax=Caldilineaceae bacterium SB0661_bin_32 TaxID=2605255 RepID=A0A6B1D1T4_9CHLR|nr:metallophosphoesterase [Caldilineaceae bacterium SB0661_bin_32]
MKVAILSDSHDNIWNLEKALAAVSSEGCDVMLHCGDLVAPFIVAQMAQAFDGPVHVIEGNNDGDGRLQQQVAAGFPQVTLHGPYAELELGGRKVALIHYPEPARRIAQSGLFDLVCYGHDHQRRHERVGECLLVNPGEVMGRYGKPSWGIYDCATHRFSLREIQTSSAD